MGYDDIPMSARKVLDLTTIRQPVDEMAMLSLEMLLARIENIDTDFEHKRIATELVVRGSTEYLPA